MKRMFRSFLLFLAVFAMAGCSNSIESRNDMNINYIDVNGSKDVIYNLKNSLSEIKSFSFKAWITKNDEKYEVEGNVISNGTIENSIININYKDGSLLIKDKNVYVSYKYKGYDIVVKDSLDNFIEEIIVSLEKNGVKCDRGEIYDVIRSKKIEDVSLNELDKFIVISEGSYKFIYDDLKISLNEQFVPEQLSFKKDDIEIKAMFSYDTVSINVPVKYDLFTLNLNDIKNLMKIENISDLIK